MNKIITLIALLVVTATAYAWDIDYSKFTVRKSSVKVSELTSDYEEASDDFGTWRKSPSWWSPDQSIVLLHHIDNREDYEFYPRSGRSEIYIITPNDNAIIGGIGKDYYIPYVNKLPAFIEIYTSSDGGDYSEFSNEEHQSKQKKDSLRMFSICSGPQCNRLIKSSTIRFYTRNYNHDAQAKIGTFDYIGDCTYKTIKTGRQEQNYIVQEVTITPHIPTTQIPLYIKSWAGPPYTNSEEFYSKESCQITNIEIEYLKPSDEDAMRKEFASAYEKESIALARTAIFWGNVNPIVATYTNHSPTDVNNDNTINSADVAAVYNDIINGTEEFNGHAYIDLGLPSGTMWAACNVGATVPEGWGDLYTYGSSMPFTNTNGFCTEEGYNYPESEPTMQGWDNRHYPTMAEFEELRDNTTRSKATINNNDCCILTSKINGRQLVFPLPGYADKSGYNNCGKGVYWLTDPKEYDTGNIYVLHIEPSPEYVYSIYDNLVFKYHAISLRMIFKP